MAFCGVRAIVVMVVVATEACDCSTMCDDMHQKIVSMVVFVWNLCSSVSFLFSRGVGTVADEMSDVRTCPVSNKFFSNLSLKASLSARYF